MTEKKEMRTNRQVRCASAKKQHNLTTYAVAIAAFLAIYCFLTFGMGHVFRII